MSAGRPVSTLPGQGQCDVKAAHCWVGAQHPFPGPDSAACRSTLLSWGIKRRFRFKKLWKRVIPGQAARWDKGLPSSPPRLGAARGAAPYLLPAERRGEHDPGKNGALCRAEAGFTVGAGRARCRQVSAACGAGAEPVRAGPGASPSAATSAGRCPGTRRLSAARRRPRRAGASPARCGSHINQGRAPGKGPSFSGRC